MRKSDKDLSDGLDKEYVVRSTRILCYSVSAGVRTRVKTRENVCTAV